MKTYEEIGKAISQGFLFLYNRKYYIKTIKRNYGYGGIIEITDKNERSSGSINLLEGEWTAELQLSDADKIRLETIAELGYNYVEICEDNVCIAKKTDFSDSEHMYCFGNLPEGRYVIDENCELKSY